MDVWLYVCVKVYDGGVTGGTSCCLNALPGTLFLIGCSDGPVYATRTGFPDPKVVVEAKETQQNSNLGMDTLGALVSRGVYPPSL